MWKTIIIVLVVLNLAAGITCDRFDDEEEFRSRDSGSSRAAYYHMIEDILSGKPSYYQVLGLERDDSNPTTASEVRRAYRKLALQAHPDKQKKGSDDLSAATSDEAWGLLTFAREVLIDP